MFTELARQQREDAGELREDGVGGKYKPDTDKRVPRVIWKVGDEKLGLLLELWVNFAAPKS